MLPTISKFFPLATSSNQTYRLVSLQKVTYQINCQKYCTAPTIFEGERKIFIDGTDINVREEGCGQHNVLCLPGLVGTIETDFGRIFEKMDKSKFRLISWDPPGYGKSRPPQRHHTLDYFHSDALRVAKLMKTLNYKQYSILGWSNGGVTGYTLAAEFPERVRNLVIWGSFAFIDDDLMRRSLKMAELSNWKKEPLEQMTKVYGRKCLEAMLTDWHDSMCGMSKGNWNHIFQERSSKVRCPVLVLHGEKDGRMLLKNAQYFAKNMKNCKMHVVLGGAHDLHLTHTDEFLDLSEKLLLASAV